MIYAATLFLSSGLVFAVHVPNGTFLHSAVALIPYAYLLTLLGVGWRGDLGRSTTSLVGRGARDARVHDHGPERGRGHGPRLDPDDSAQLARLPGDDPGRGGAPRERRSGRSRHEPRCGRLPLPHRPPWHRHPGGSTARGRGRPPPIRHPVAGPGARIQHPGPGSRAGRRGATRLALGARRGGARRARSPASPRRALYAVCLAPDDDRCAR